MTDSFRRNYTRLWGAIVSSNSHDIKKYSEKLNVGTVYPLLASILTFKSWDDITSNDLSRLEKSSKFAICDNFFLYQV